jgi:hypothetical protein
MWTRGPHRSLLVAVVFPVGLVLALAGCGSSSDDSTGTAASGPTRTSDSAPASTTAAGTTATTSARASRATPLAERVFRIKPEPTNRTQQAAVQTLQDYLDGMITGFATNSLRRTGLRDLTSPGMYADARRLIAEQISKGYVLYGSWTFTIQPRGISGRAAVVDVCINQSQTRRHNAKTDAAGRRNNEPYVRLTYTLNRLEAGWVVVDDAGRPVASCPG